MVSLINKDGFFDVDIHIQAFPQEIEKVFNAGGWRTIAKYRAVAPLTDANGVKDPYRKTFAETYLFSSTGSDGQTRYFGMTVGYGGKRTQYGEEPVITKDMFFGEMEEIEEGLVYGFKVKPVVPSSVVLYREDGSIISPSESWYEVDGEAGTVTFAKPQTGKIRATYALTDNAPDLVKRVWFFTFEGFLPTRYVSRKDNPELAQLEDLPNRTFRFKINPVNMRIRENSYKFYDSLDGTVPLDPSTYTVNHDEGTVVFNEGTEPLALFADYEIEYKPFEDVNYGDIEVTPFDPSKPKSLMSAAYEAVRFIYPSIPTAVSFIPQNELGLGWSRDAVVYYWGNINRDRIVSYFRLDPAPDPESTYFVPLYIGRLATIGKSPQANTVLIGGCRPEDEIRYEPGLKLGRTIVDYGVNTSNGNSSVLLQRSIGGSMYQKHYLAFITHDKEIDPSNESRFNPSVYTGKYTTAPMFIVHPSDGYVGRLDEVYAIHPKGIAQLDELEIREVSEGEFVGTGDGERKVFHLYHTPVIDDDFELRFVKENTCTYIGKEGYVPYDQASNLRAGQFTIEPNTKQLILGEAPEDGVEIFATYSYNQVYRFTMADTPVSPFTLANISPFAPIGLGFLKENI